MKALITGITGFAGSFLAEHLLACGDQLLGCSRRGRWRHDAPESLRQQVPLVEWDIQRPPSLEVVSRIRGFEPAAVYHLAALSVPADCGRERPTERALAVNVGGTEAVLSLVLQLDPTPRLLLVSSPYVYAEVDPSEPVVDEQAACAPRRGYGMTKLAAEQHVREAVAQHALHAVIARAFQHTGPRQSPRLMLPEWARQFADGTNPVRVFCLDTFLDLTDVRDVVAAYRLLMQQGRSGQAYNVGSGICRRSGDIFERLRAMADPGRDVLELSPGVRQQPIADNRRLVADTGWQPRIPLEKTLADTLHFWQNKLGRTS